jgi:hypothetical protein
VDRRLCRADSGIPGVWMGKKMRILTYREEKGSPSARVSKFRRLTRSQTATSPFELEGFSQLGKPFKQPIFQPKPHPAPTRVWLLTT